MDETYFKRDIDNLKKMIHEMGFGEMEAELLKYARPSIRVETTPVDNEDDLAIGQSKLGGRPDLPKDVDWVKVKTHNGLASLSFLGQIDLVDAKPHDAEDLLPDSGILYFFGDPWRASDDKNRGQVILFEGEKTELERKLFPEDMTSTRPIGSSHYQYNSNSLAFIHEVNLDYQAVYELEDLPKGKTWEDLSDLIETTNYTFPPFPPIEVKRILGIADDVPEDMQLDCQLLEDRGRVFNSSVAAIEIANQRKDDWQLLFQISSDRNTDMAWYDLGIICFYIKNQDLAAKNFDNTCFAFFSS